MVAFNPWEIESESRRLRYRRIILSTILLPAGIVIANALSRLWQTYFPIDSSVSWWVSWGITIIPVILIVEKLVARSWPRDPDLIRGLVQHGREVVQRGRLRRAVLIVVVLASVFVSGIDSTLHPGTQRPGIGDTRWLLPVCALGFLLEITGVKFGRAMRVTVDDEFTRFLRARALCIGYVVVVVAMSVVYVGGLYFRSVADFGLPTVLFLSIAVPTIMFAVFERRAGGLD